MRLLHIFVTGMLLATAALNSYAQSQTANQNKAQKIEKILDLTQGSAAVKGLVEQVRGMLQQIQPAPSAKQADKREDALKKIEKLVTDRLKKVRPELARIYSEAFSDPEIDGLLAFYESPAGRAAIEKLPAVNQRVAGMVQTQIDALGQEIDKIAEDALKN